jgi:hypothetical protein
MIKRSSKAGINKLLAEIRNACGLRTNAQAMQHYEKAYAFIYKHSGATLSIYMNDAFTISKTGTGASFMWRYVEITDWLDKPSEIIAVWKTV